MRKFWFNPREKYLLLAWSSVVKGYVEFVNFSLEDMQNVSWCDLLNWTSRRLEYRPLEVPSNLHHSMVIWITKPHQHVLLKDRFANSFRKITDLAEGLTVVYTYRMVKMPEAAVTWNNRDTHQESSSQYRIWEQYCSRKVLNKWIWKQQCIRKSSCSALSKQHEGEYYKDCHIIKRWPK